MLKKILITLLLTTLFLINSVAAQNSRTYRYDAIKGTKILTEAHEKNTFFVTCSHTSDGRSCFLIEYSGSNTRKSFYTTPYVAPTPHAIASGYIVNDMVIARDYTCWFCGEKWVRTGQYIYNSNGLAYPETVYYSYVGKFSLQNAINGGGNYETMTFSPDYTMENIAVSKSGIVTVTGGRYLWEFSPNTDGSYNYKVGESSQNSEVFVDVVCRTDTVVVLSRFNNPDHYFYYHDMFALRYDTPYNFVGNNNTMYRYDTYYINYDHSCGFDTLSPIKLCSINTGSGVAVAYVTPRCDFPYNNATDATSYSISPGKLLLYKFDKKNTIPSKIIYSTDTATYTKIKDLSASVFDNNYYFIALLLEDSINRSIIRYPILNHFFSISDTIKTISTIQLDEIQAYQNSSTLANNLMGAGFAMNNQNKLSEAFDFAIHSQSPFSFFYCLTNSFGVLNYINSPNPSIKTTQNYLINQITSGIISPTSTQYASTDAVQTLTCGPIPISE